MRHLQASRPAYQHHVISLSRWGRIRILRQQIYTCSLAEPATEAVARSGSTQLPADCYSDPPTAIRVGKCKCNQRATGEDAPATHHAIKVLSSLEAEALFHGSGGKTSGVRPKADVSCLPGRELTAASAALVLEDPATTRRMHPPKKAVDATPITLLGLVRALDG